MSTSMPKPVREMSAQELLEAHCQALQAENERLKDAIRWALGETEFAPRPEGGGAYWWRTELSERSGVDWESSPNNPKNQPADQPTQAQE